MKKITMLGWAGCEVKSVRLDSFKAVIHVEPCNGLVAQFHDKEFGVIEDGEIRVVWRVSDTESGRVHHD